MTLPNMKSDSGRRTATSGERRLCKGRQAGKPAAARGATDTEGTGAEVAGAADFCPPSHFHDFPPAPKNEGGPLFDGDLPHTLLL